MRNQATLEIIDDINWFVGLFVSEYFFILCIVVISFVLIAVERRIMKKEEKNTKKKKQTATHIEKALSRHVDYLLAGHMHVPEMRAEDTMYIRNGSVCGSGDDYTVKKRLFSPPCQVFMVISKTGDVDSVHTVNLSGITESAATEVG